MKTFNRIVLFSVISIAAFSIAISLMLRSDENVFSKDSKWVEEINEEKTVDGINVSTININVDNSDIRIYKSQDDQIKVLMDGRLDTFGFKGEREFSVNREENELTIINKLNNIGIGYVYSDVKLNVFIPESFAGDITIDTVSADVTINSFALNHLNIKSVSGDINLSDVTYVDSTITTTSGDLNLNDVVFNLMNIKTVSGDFDGANINGNIDFDTTSGDVDIKHTATEFNMDFHTVSGDIELDLLNDAQFNIDFATVSGDFERENFEITIGSAWSDTKKQGKVGDSTNTIDIKTVSGDVSIY